MDGILVINKPQGMTSHDVIGKLRRRYNQKKFGHTGTLDPMASGVLVVMAGKATKILQFLDNTDKAYVAQIELGYDTSTDDVFGEKTSEKEICLDFDFQKELDQFKGKLHQQIPMTSAKKVNGKKLMDYQRQGIEIEPQYKDVEVYDIQALDEEALRFFVSCSSGTFVRAICRDLAHNTGNAGCMKSLVRTQVGNFNLEQAQEIDAPEHTLYSIEQALAHFPKADYEKIEDIYNGKTVHLNTDAPMAAIWDNDKVIAIYERKENGMYGCKRGLW
jgi:tRNA pseudouridine55 synthase